MAGFPGRFAIALDCNGAASALGDAAFLPYEAAARLEGKAARGRVGREDFPGFAATLRKSR
jgi:hypothetical protein